MPHAPVPLCPSQTLPQPTNQSAGVEFQMSFNARQSFTQTFEVAFLFCQISNVTMQHIFGDNAHLIPVKRGEQIN
jgi:hypothetical protein